MGKCVVLFSAQTEAVVLKCIDRTPFQFLYAQRVERTSVHLTECQTHEQFCDALDTGACHEQLPPSLALWVSSLRDRPSARRCKTHNSGKPEPLGGKPLSAEEPPRFVAPPSRENISVVSDREHPFEVADDCNSVTTLCVFAVTDRGEDPTSSRVFHEGLDQWSSSGRTSECKFTIKYRYLEVVAASASTQTIWVDLPTNASVSAHKTTEQEPPAAYGRLYHLGASCTEF